MNPLASIVGTKKPAGNETEITISGNEPFGIDSLATSGERGAGERNPVAGETQATDSHSCPCSVCGCAIVWKSAYGPATHCAGCQGPSRASLAAAWFLVVLIGGRVVGGVAVGGRWALERFTPKYVGNRKG